MRLQKLRLMKANDKFPAWFISAVFIFLAVIGLSYFFYTAPQEAAPNTFETDSNPPGDDLVRSLDEKIPEQQIVRGEEELDANNPTINAVTKNAVAVGDEIQNQNQEESFGFSSRIKKILDEGEILDTRTQFEEGSEVKRLLIQSKIHETPIIVEERRNAAGQVRYEAYLSDQIIVKVRDGLSISELESNLEPMAARVRTHMGGELYSIVLDRADLDSVQECIAFFSSSSGIIIRAEVDGIVFAMDTPNDPYFNEAWHLQNTGQFTGAVDNIDLDAIEFWDALPDTPEVVMGVLDTGINKTHLDLQGLLWVNPNETADDGIDNDGNGYIDDIFGWDFVNDDNDPSDDNGHGTKVTGVIAANINNSTSVTGLLTNPTIVVCKIFDEEASGFSSDVMQAMSYLKNHGVPIINYSGGGSSYQQSYYDLIEELSEADVLLTVSAGNDAQDNDAVPHYPSSYDNSNIISVGGHDWDGTIKLNYGQASVDLFAPGVRVVTTGLDNSWWYMNGSSFSAPMVAAVAAAIKRIKPNWTTPDIKQAILSSVVKDDDLYGNLCVSGGRLNAHNALLVANAIDDGRNDVQSDPSSYTLYTAAEITTARTNGRSDVTSDPSSYSLYTASDVSTAETSARTAGQSDVTSDPGSYSLYTSSDVSTAEATARTTGRSDVTSDPATYSLHTASEVSASRTAGQTDVTSDPSSYSLYTASDVSTAETSARTAGRSDVTSDPSSYSLYTASDVSTAEAAARTAGQGDITSDPGSYSLYTASDVSTTEASARTAGQSDVTSDPSSYSLYTATELSSAEAASRTLGQQDVTASPETYELATMAQMSAAAEAARTIVNVSARVALGAGEIVTPGFVVLGEQKKMLIRAVGPKLADLGVGSPLPNPTMTVYKSRWDGNPPDLIATIDDWKADNDNVAEIVSAMSSAGAFPLEPTETFQGRPFLTDDTSSAAALVTLDVGVYTVQVRSADDGFGEVLVEVYEVTD